MEYSSPELIELGRAEMLVLGNPFGEDDNLNSKDTQPALGLALGLDD